MCVPLFLLSVAYFFSFSFLFINFGPSLPPSIPSLFFWFSVYHVFLTSMCVLCVCLFTSSFLSLSSLSSLPLNLEQSPLINYNVNLTKKVCVCVRVNYYIYRNVETIKATINSLSKLFCFIFSLFLLIPFFLHPSLSPFLHFFSFFFF